MTAGASPDATRAVAPPLLDRLQISQAWLASAALIALSVAAYFQTFRELWPLWEHKNATYTHGSLVALVAIWLVWRRREWLIDRSPAPSLTAMPVALLLSAAWLLAARSNLMLAHMLLWPVLTLAIVWAGAGLAAARAMAFPVGFLYFAVPVWEVLKPPLQAIASVTVGFLTELAGVQAIVEGPYVLLPRDTVYIALDCSGAHFLSVALAVGALAGELRRDNWKMRLGILVFAAALSMVFNWLRIFLIVLAYLDPDLKDTLETMGHYTFGWWVFALDLVVFFLAMRALPPPEVRAERMPRLPTSRSSLAVSAGIPLALAAALVLPATSWALTWKSAYPPVPDAAPALAGLTGPVAADPQWRPGMQGAAWTHRAAYIAGEGRVVELYQAVYHRQAQGSELIGGGRSLFDPLEFRLVERARLAVPGLGADGAVVNRLQLETPGGRGWLALYAYVVDGRVMAGERATQLWTGARAMFGHPVASVLAVAAPCVPDCAAVEPHLAAVFAAAFEAYRQQEPAE